MKVLVGGVIAVVVAALVLVSVGDDDEETTATSAKPQAPARVERVRLAGSNVGAPQPFSASPGGGGIQVVSLLFDTLTWHDAAGNVIPMLATKWEYDAKDATKLRFTLREGVTWSDGQPFTADDVVFTWEYQQRGRPGFAGGSSGSAFSQRGVANVVALSPTLVEFTTDPADSTFFWNAAARNFIFPRHVWESVADPLTYVDPPAFVGTGPYTLGSYDPAQSSYQFLAKDSYFLGPPHVRRVEYVPAPDQLLALQSGGIDMADIGTGTYTRAQLDSLDTAVYGQVRAGGILTYALMYNMTGYPYNDVRFRQALAWAIDRPDMAKRLFPLGGGPTNIGMLQPNDSAWVPRDTLGTTKYAPRDVAKANALLDAVGLTIPPGQTMRFNGGSQFRPTIMITGTPDAFNIVHQNLLDVGIDAQVQSVSSAQLNTNATGGSYEMILRSFGASSDPDGLRTWLSSSAPASWWHSVGWSSQTFESLLRLQKTQFNEEDRKQTGFQMQRLIADELPELFLVGADRIAVFDKRVVSTWAYPGGVRPAGPAGVPNPYSKLTFIQAPSSTSG